MTDQRITDFAVWDIQDEFTPNEAAYLWLGLEPSHAIGGHPAKVISLSNTLSSEVQKGALPARQGDPRLWEGPYIKRESLKAWAERKGQQPLFLFPECRQTISVSENGQQDLPPKSPPVSLSDIALGAQRREPFQTPTTPPADNRRSEEQRAFAKLQHAERNSWYASKVAEAHDQWKKGSTLRHDQMAGNLMKDAPEGISKNTLLGKLTKLLRDDLNLPDLIRGNKK